MRVAIALALALILSAATAAQDTHGITPDKRVAKALADLADTCFECGEKAREAGLNTTARSFYSHALGYNTDHRQTRRVMGFKKQRDGWVLEKDLVPKADTVPEAKRADAEQRLADATLPARRKAADLLFKFVADTKLESAQRLLALHNLLLICPEHRGGLAAARATPARMWFKHDLDADSESQRDARLEAAPQPEKLDAQSTYESATGFSMAKRRTPWFIVHLDLGETGPVWADGLARLAEASRTHVLGLMGAKSPAPPKEDAHRLHFTVLGTRERFAAFVEKCSGIEDPRHRAEVSKASDGTTTYSPYGAVWLYPDVSNDWGLRDAIAHDVAIKEVFRCTGDGAYWLAQGMGYLASTHMNSSTAARFYGVKASSAIESGGKDAMPGLGNSPAGWRLHAALMAAGGRVITPGKLAALRVSDFRAEHMAMAFCWADFLAARRADQMKKFYDSAQAERAARLRDKRAGETPEELVSRLYTALETDEAALTVAFSTWVLEEYVRLPQG